MSSEKKADEPLSFSHSKRKFSLRDFARNYGYSIYVLFALLLAYLLNQLDRYMLAITAQPMAQEIHFGDHGCLANKTTDFPHLDAARCNGTTEAMCTDIIVNGTTDVCKWDYNGQGYEYQVVAGPVFTLVYTFAGIFIGFAADRYNRKLLLAICLMFWSVMTIVTGFIKEYWQLVVLRFGLGFGEAGCTPFATSLIADYYTESVRGLALGVYNWGIYMGYSFSYLLGNRIMEANIFDQGWRSTFYLSGIPGVILGVIIIFSVKEPVRPSRAVPPSNIQNGEVGMCGKLVTILRPFLSPSLIMLCVAGSIRNAAGYVWAYNTQPYFRAIQQTPDQISSWMGWIPLVGGSIGVVTGGFISDRFVKNRGLYARVFVLVASQILAAPFAAGTLYFNPPYGYVCQIPTYIIGEMWVGVTLTVVVELVPSTIRASAVAVYLFIITNIGGAFPLLVPPLQQHFEAVGASKAEALRDALYILYPGLYVGGAALFLLTMFMLKRDQRRAQQADYQPILGDNKEK